MSGTGTGVGGSGTLARTVAAVLTVARATTRLAVGCWIPVRRARASDPDAGTTTAEYAMVTMAAVAFAGLLALVLRSDEVRGMLTDLVHKALSQ